MRVECPEDGKLSSERRIQGIRGAYPAFRCHIEINLLYVVCHNNGILYKLKLMYNNGVSRILLIT